MGLRWAMLTEGGGDLLRHRTTMRPESVGSAVLHRNVKSWKREGLRGDVGFHRCSRVTVGPAMLLLYRVGDVYINLYGTVWVLS